MDLNRFDFNGPKRYLCFQGKLDRLLNRPKLKLAEAFWAKQPYNVQLKKKP